MQWGWSNRDNFPFYAQLGGTGLALRASQCGLVAGADLKALLPALPERPSEILEIGAGYGRAASHLRRVLPDARLTLLEISDPCAALLAERFARDANTTLVRGSVLEQDFLPRFDLALWLWAGFLDFAPEEKAAALQRIHRWLKPGALLAIELPRTVGREVQVHSSNLVLEFFGTRWHGHLIDADEMKALAARTGFTHRREILYQTDNRLERTIHLLEKP